MHKPNSKGVMTHEQQIEISDSSIDRNHEDGEPQTGSETAAGAPTDNGSEGGNGALSVWERLGQWMVGELDDISEIIRRSDEH